MKTKFFFVLLVGMLVTTVALPNSARADTGRITRGDVEAILNAFTTGGREILSHQSGAAGFDAAPADFQGSNGAIRPFGSWNGLHVCVNDWHVLLIAEFDGGDKSYTMQDAKNYLSQVDNLFYLDGNLVQTTSTPIKRFLNPAAYGLEEAYGFQTGAIMAPGELQIGQHTFKVHVVDPVYGDADLQITFYVDGSSSSTCN
jgi:hypothetical protein